MLKAKILREAGATEGEIPVKQPATKQPAPAAPAKAQPAPAAPAQPDQKQVMQQATEAIKQIVMPIVTQVLNDYFQKTFPGVLQNALKGQKAPAPAAPAQKSAPAAPAAPAPAAPVKK